MARRFEVADLWERVEQTSACWIWHGYRSSNGYGKFGSRWAHRAVYELLVGPIPEGKTLDHLCRVRHCVNPAHLEPVTNRENILRGRSFGAVNADKSHCPRGHPYSDENTALEVSHPHGYRSVSRRCRTCHRLRERERRVRSG